MEDGEIKEQQTIEHYGCVVDMLGRVGMAEDGGTQNADGSKCGDMGNTA